MTQKKQKQKTRSIGDVKNNYFQTLSWGSSSSRRDRIPAVEDKYNFTCQNLMTLHKTSLLGTIQ